MDHNTEETIEMSRALGVWCGHSLYPVTKMSPPRMVALLQKYGLERMIVNSAADWGQSDPLAIPKTIDLMWQAGFGEAEIKRVVWDNPFQFFAQSERFRIPGVNA
jgi:predicted metal-dependent TIM-barrel fold hydrolase